MSETRNWEEITIPSGSRGPYRDAEKDAAIIRLREVERLTFREIGRRAGYTAQAALSRYRAAKTRATHAEFHHNERQS